MWFEFRHRRTFACLCLLAGVVAVQNEVQPPSSLVKATARQLWISAERRSAQLGKGSAADPNSLVLLTQHWLEVIDVHHRYGSNLATYHAEWLNSSSPQNFFHWLDYGDGRHVDLGPECPRSKLARQTVLYCSRQERERYRVISSSSGRLIYAQSGKPLDTLPPQHNGETSLSTVLPPEKSVKDTPEEHARNKAIRKAFPKYIYVVDTDHNLYVGKKEKGRFHHTSFLCGASVYSAGALVASDGLLLRINPYSGHYQPAQDRFLRLVALLKSQGVDFSKARVVLNAQAGIEADEE